MARRKAVDRIKLIIQVHASRNGAPAHSPEEARNLMLKDGAAPTPRHSCSLMSNRRSGR